MGRFAHHLNNLLNVIFVAAAAALIVLFLLSLFGGPTLRFVPHMAGVCALYYLTMAAKIYGQGERKSAFRGTLLLLLALLCAAFALIAYRSLL